MSSISLADVLDPSSTLGQHVFSGLAEVEEFLDDSSFFPDESVTQVAQHLLNAGGKRIRPLLTIVCAHLGSGELSESQAKQVVRAGAVVELTHLATLYHDDVMDSAPTRRGAPSAHQVWGNTVAILTGDMLFARASKIVAELGPDAVTLQAETFERLCIGQLKETVGPQDSQDPIAFHLDVLAGKTGSLIATSARFGAIFGGCSPEVVAAVTNFGELIGVAFQVADDVLDLTSDSAVSGKTPGTDLREGVPTLPVLFAKQAAAQGDQAAQKTVELLEQDLSSDEALHNAVVALTSLPAVAKAQQAATQMAKDALAELEILPAGEAKELLVALAISLAHRDS